MNDALSRMLNLQRGLDRSVIKARQQVLIAERLADENRAAVREAIIAGLTTGDRIDDFVVIAHRQMEEAAGHYRRFEELLARHVGELAMLLITLETSITGPRRFNGDPGHGQHQLKELPRPIEVRRTFQVAKLIGGQLVLNLERGEVLLPTDNVHVEGKDEGGRRKDAALAGGPIDGENGESFVAMTDRMGEAVVHGTTGKRQWFIGNEAVASQFNTPEQAAQYIEICRLLKINPLVTHQVRNVLVSRMSDLAVEEQRENAAATESGLAAQQELSRRAVERIEKERGWILGILMGDGDTAAHLDLTEYQDPPREPSPFGDIPPPE